MYLQKLEVQGFKSFAHKTTFLFSRGQGESRGLTAIVGPNGSGKSNVADAIRWVLGEQSMKLLRSKKSEDVIFFGSDAKAQLGFCEVSLLFNNEDHAFPVEYSEVVIARRLYRNGESEYIINGAKVRLSDVIMLLAQGNCGQRSYSVIGQGMIDSLVTMSPSERKHFFDEAAGVRAHQLKKDQAASKLKTTKEHVASAHMLIAELEPKIAFFQRQIKRFEEREHIERELKNAYQNYYASAWHALKKEEMRARASQADIQKNLSTALSRHTLLSQEFQQYQKQSQEPHAHGAAQLRVEYDALIQRRTALVSRLSLIDARLTTEYEKSGETNLSFLLQRKAELESQKTQNAHNHEKNKQEILALSQSLGELSGELDGVDRCIAEMQSAHSAPSFQTDISLGTIHDALEVLRKERQYFFSSERTVEEIQEALERLFVKIDAICESINPSEKNTPDETLQAEQALTDLLGKQREVLMRIQEVRIAQGVRNHEISQLERASLATAREIERIEQELMYFSSADRGEKNAQLQKEQEEARSALAALDEKIRTLKKQLDSAYEEQSKSTSELLRIQRALTEAQQDIDALRSSETTLSLELAKGEAHQEELLGKMSEELGLDEEMRLRIQRNNFDASLVGLEIDVPLSAPLSELRPHVERLKRKLESIGAIDRDALAEYESTKERFEFLTRQAEDLTASICSLEKGIAELELNIKESFNRSLSGIEKKFCQYFQQLFNGGSARIVAVKRSDIESDEEDEESDEKEYQHSGISKDEIVGIDISAMPPGKKLKNMSVLSGGEKALTAIALICAIVSCNPSPFVVLDEVDAALDESNANRFALIIKELGGKTQFIVVTHNRATIHMAQCMYGVTMGDDGISKVLSLDIARIDDTLASIKNDS